MSSSETKGYLNCAEWSVYGIQNKPGAGVLPVHYLMGLVVEE